MASRTVLVDTNILLRMTRVDDPDYSVVTGAVAALLERGATLCYTHQNIAEFWNVATRPTHKNGFGLSIKEVDTLVQTIEAGMFLLAQETEAVYREWRQLVVTHSVAGVEVHDARLVATMRIHEVQDILTFNVKDFQRYAHIQPVHPAKATE